MLAISRRATRGVLSAAPAVASSSTAAAPPTGRAGAAAPEAEAEGVAPPSARATGRGRRARAAADVDVETVDLVAPPDPVSNMRPIMYASPRRQPTNSPYSAAEFPAAMTGKEGAQAVREMEWRMMRERVDMANHRFWASTNTAFQTHLAARLAALPPPSDPPTPQDEAAREAVLTQFYRDWQIGTRAAQSAWVRQWWRDVWEGIKAQGRVYLGRWGV